MSDEELLGIDDDTPSIEPEETGDFEDEQLEIKRLCIEPTRSEWKRYNNLLCREMSVSNIPGKSLDRYLDYFDSLLDVITFFIFLAGGDKKSTHMEIVAIHETEMQARLALLSSKDAIKLHDILAPPQRAHIKQEMSEIKKPGRFARFVGGQKDQNTQEGGYYE